MKNFKESQCGIDGSVCKGRESLSHDDKWQWGIDGILYVSFPA